MNRKNFLKVGALATAGILLPNMNANAAVSDNLSQKEIERLLQSTEDLTPVEVGYTWINEASQLIYFNGIKMGKLCVINLRFYVENAQWGVPSHICTIHAKPAVFQFLCSPVPDGTQNFQLNDANGVLNYFGYSGARSAPGYTGYVNLYMAYPTR